MGRLVFRENRMASVTIRDVHKLFGGTHVLHGVSVDIDDGEFVTLVGPSGCGKSTLLRMIAGLESISRGDIAIGGRVVNRVAPKERDIAMVFQNYALYPHMTVAENMAFSLMLKKASKAETEARLKRAAEILGLTPLLARYPRQLSGGQRQRVAMGRAIVRDPQVFLFDEPLSNLDAKLRVAMRAEIKELHQRLKTTTIYVTHDQIEAMTMADKIVVMHDGIVEQIGKPLELYDRPGNLFVASFIGSPAMNLLKGSISADGATFEGAGGIAVPLGGRRATAGAPVTLGIRPEHLTRGDGGFPVTVSVMEPTGAEVQIIGRTSGEQEIVANFRDRYEFSPGETVHLTAEPKLIHLFDGATGQRLEG
jgi:multiple sugar transport system ATP-binding protein